MRFYTIAYHIPSIELRFRTKMQVDSGREKELFYFSPFFAFLLYLSLSLYIYTQIYTSVCCFLYFTYFNPQSMCGLFFFRCVNVVQELYTSVTGVSNPRPRLLDIFLYLFSVSLFCLFLLLFCLFYIMSSFLPPFIVLTIKENVFCRKKKKTFICFATCFTNLRHAKKNNVLSSEFNSAKSSKYSKLLD